MRLIRHCWNVARCRKNVEFFLVNQFSIIYMKRFDSTRQRLRSLFVFLRITQALISIIICNNFSQPISYPVFPEWENPQNDKSQFHGSDKLIAYERSCRYSFCLRRINLTRFTVIPFLTDLHYNIIIQH